MTIVALSPGDGDLLVQATAIYLESFPHRERLPVAEVLTSGIGGRQVTVSVECGRPTGRVVTGLMVTVPMPDVAFLEYLAVAPGRRSGGVGATLVRHLLAEVGDTDVLAELEPAGSAPDAERRERFYSRQGFAPAPWQGDYGMPAPDGSLVPLTLWHRADVASPGHPASFMRDVYTRAYGERGRPHLDHILAGTHP